MLRFRFTVFQYMYNNRITYHKTLVFVAAERVVVNENQQQMENRVSPRKCIHDYKKCSISTSDIRSEETNIAITNQAMSYYTTGIEYYSKTSNREPSNGETYS